jgi:transcriptional regulator with XRE-family HTH domain
MGDDVGMQVRSSGVLTDGQDVSDALALVIARAIRAERHRADLTQQELADRIGMHRGTLGAIESVTRRVNADELPAICGALGVTLSELLVKATPEDRSRLGLDT